MLGNGRQHEARLLGSVQGERKPNPWRRKIYWPDVRREGNANPAKKGGRGRDWRPTIFAPSDAREAVVGDGTGMNTVLGGTAWSVIDIVGAQRKRARPVVLQS